MKLRCVHVLTHALMYFCVSMDARTHIYIYACTQDVASLEYELPEDFEDEEIDEDNVWTREDTKEMGDNPFGLDDDEEEEEEDDEEEEEEEDDEYDDDEEDNDEEEGDEVFDAFDRLDEDEEDDDDDDEVGDEGYRDVLRAARKGDTHDGSARRTRTNVDVITEIHPESQFNIDPSAYTSGAAELTVGDLTAAAMNGAADEKNIGNNAKKLHKTLGKILGATNASSKGASRAKSGNGPESVPLPSNIRDRFDRQVGYEQTSKDVAMWQDMVKHNREARTIRFPRPSELAPRPLASVAEIISSGPSSSKTAKGGNDKKKKEDNGGGDGDGNGRPTLERQVEDLLREAGAMTARDIASGEQDAMLTKGVTNTDDLRERQAKLLKMRSLMFQHEIKAKRLKKIKSKEYRRKLKKAEKRKIEKEFENGDADIDDIAEEDPEHIRELSLRAEKDRAVERISLKHSNSSKWAKRIIQRGVKHSGGREMQAALGEQLAIGRKKREGTKAFGHNKPVTGTSSDDEDGDSSAEEFDDDVDDDDNADNAIDDDGGEPPKGLLALPFMQRAMQKKKREADRAEQEMFARQEKQNESDSGDDDDDYQDEDEDDAFASKSAHNGRMRFGGASQKAAVISDDDEYDSGDDDAGNDEAMRTRGAPTEDEDGLDARDSLHRGPSTSGRTHKPTKPTKAASCGHTTRDTSLVTAPESATRTENTPADSVEKEADDVARESRSHMTPAVDARKQSSYENSQAYQRKLVQEAFAGDDVADDFAQLKRQEVDAELPVVEEMSALPGWGLWSNQQKKPKWMVRQEEAQRKQRKIAASKRADKGLKNVIISEKFNKKAAKYSAEELPHECRSKLVYEASLSTPLAPELNTVGNFKVMSRPKVLKTPGAPIPAPQASRKFAKVDVQKNTVNSSRVVINPLSAMAERKGVTVVKEKRQKQFRRKKNV